RTRYPPREVHVCQFDRFPDDPPIGKEQYDTIVFGNILDVVVKPEQRLALVEKYLRFRPSRIIIYDLERLDVTPFNHRFGHPTVKTGSVSLPIDEVKRHRKILVYET